MKSSDDIKKFKQLMFEIYRISDAFPVYLIIDSIFYNYLSCYTSYTICLKYDMLNFQDKLQYKFINDAWAEKHPIIYDSFITNCNISEPILIMGAYDYISRISKLRSFK
jgi:hypothetical protein